MIIKQRNAIYLYLGLFLINGLLQLTHTNFYITTSLLAFFLYLVLPGILLSRIFRMPRLSFWEHVLLNIGLSIAFLEFGGLLINDILPVLHFTNPLNFTHIFWGFTVLFIPLFFFAWKRSNNQLFVLPSVSSTWLESIFYLVPVAFPFLAAFGAFRLNNGGTNILTMTLLGGIGLYTLCLVLFRKKLKTPVFLFSLFFIALSLLFTTSLRGWFITGHDIQREYYVFQLTNVNHIWDINFYRDAYNACLSITILPTILTNMLQIKDMYVYKIVFQLLFATTPVLIFLILKRYTVNAVAFLAAFYYMAFPTFSNDMPMLNRQEIGFIFFGLVLYILLIPTIPVKLRKLLFLIFTASVVISHYSTNYVLLVLLTFVYFFSFFVSFTRVQLILQKVVGISPLKVKNTFFEKRFLTSLLLIFMFTFTFFWNTLYTHTSNNITAVFGEVVQGIFAKKASTATKSQDVSYSILGGKATTLAQIIQNDITTEVAAAVRIKEANFFAPSTYAAYPIKAAVPDQVPQTKLGDLLTRLHLPIFKIQTELRSIASLFMQFAVFIGIIAVFFYKNKKKFNADFLFLALGGVFLLVLEIILPAISAEYGLLRMFQQFLYIFSLLIVLGTMFLFSFLKEGKRVVLAALIAILFFLTLTGFISHVTGDYYTTMTLDNSGTYYDSYYLHAQNIAAIEWLSKNKTKYGNVTADLLNNVALLNYGDIQSDNNMFPALITKDEYVLLSASNHVLVSIQKDVHSFVSPQPFLDKNKNLIYSNGTDNIYN